MLDQTSFVAALKEYYTDDAVEDMTYEDNPLFALMPKDEEFYGKYKVIPVKFGNPQGRSQNFVRAQTRGAATSTKLIDFAITRVHDYSLAQIDNETILASQNDRGAFMDAATTEIDGAIKELSNTLALDLYRAGFGDRGQVLTASFASTVITLLNTDDVVNFEVGQELVISATQGGGVLRALGSSGNGLIITGIDRSAGTLTFAYNVNDSTNGIPNIAGNDYLFIRGDRDDASSPARLKVSGLEAWIPQGGPTSAAFFGVDRTKDSTRLGGLYYDGSALPIEEALIEGAIRSGKHGAAIDHYFVPFTKYGSLEKALGSKVQYVDLQANARVGFRGIRINGPRSEINVVPDRNCPPNRAYGLTLNTWKFGSIGKAVRVINTDELEKLRLATADGIEVRYGYYGNAYTKAPGKNINLVI